MANINDYINVAISLSVPRVPSQEAFGVPLLAAYHTHYTDRVRFYTSTAAMVSDGFSLTEPAYLAAEVIFAQPNGPTQLAIGRRALAPLQVLNLTCTSAVAGDAYNATFIDSAGVSHSLAVASTGVPATDAATIATAITAFTLAGCTVSHASAVVTLTQTAGHLVNIQNWPQFLNISDTTADPGIATDLAAIQAANNLGWYALLLDSNSKAEVLSAASWVEATGRGGKVGFFNTSDFAVAAGTSGNVQLAMQAAAYGRSICPYTGTSILNYLGAGAAAYALGQTPGSYALSWKSFPLVIADNDQSLTETQALAINTASTSSPGTGGQGGNYYRIVAGIPIFWPGVAPDASWFDQTIGIDALMVTAQANLFAYLASLPKVPFDDFGIGNVGDNLVASVRSFASPPAGPNQNALIDGSQPIVLTKPTASSVSPTNKQNRNLVGMSVSATLAGAINTVGVTIALAA
jgi:hypothetical protein